MKYCISFFLLFSFYISKAQLTNTTWIGDFAVPSPMECSFIFTADTALVKLNETNEILEIMTYRVSGDTLFLKKVSGMSPCNDGEPAVYSYKIKDKRLNLSPLDDVCDIRRDAFPANGLVLSEP